MSQFRSELQHRWGNDVAEVGRAATGRAGRGRPGPARAEHWLSVGRADCGG